MTSGHISTAFEGLAQGLRVLSEAHWKAHGGGLLRIDRAEAVGNIETGLGSVLNAFHSLQDAIEKEMEPHPVDWYSTAELATILALRNARHHNKANRIRTLYTYHAQEAGRPVDLDNYVCIDFPAVDQTADTIDLFLSWQDFDLLLSLPKKESRLKPEVCQLIRDYLGAARFGEYSRRYRLPKRKVFLNVTPLIVNAAAVIVPSIRERIVPSSTEGEFFFDHFLDVERGTMESPEVSKCVFYLYE